MTDSTNPAERSNVNGGWGRGRERAAAAETVLLRGLYLPPEAGRQTGNGPDTLRTQRS